MTTPVRELAPGDVVQTGYGLAEMIEPPFLGQGGASVFDDRELFLRARARLLGARERVVCLTWPVAHRVTVLRTA